MSSTEAAKDVYLQYRYFRDNGHDAFLERSELAQRYWIGKQWCETDEAAYKAADRPLIVVNQVFQTINSVLGELGQLSTDVRFSSTTGDEQTADALNKMSEHVDRTNKLFIVDQQVQFNALLTGRGYYEIRMDFDDNLQGDISIRSRRPQNVLLDPSVDSIDPTTWDRVITTDLLSRMDIDALYGAAAAEEVRGRPSPDWFDPMDQTLRQTMGLRGPGYYDTTPLEDSKYIKQYRQVSEQYFDLRYKDFFVDLQTGDMEEIPENWDRNKIAYVKEQFGYGTTRRRARTLRWRVCVHDMVVHDEDSPYKFFTIVPYMPFFVDGVTQSLFDVIQGSQDLLNKSLSQELHILATTANSGWKIKHGSLKNMTLNKLERIGSKNGLVLSLDDVNDAERIEPGNTPTAIQNLSTRAEQWSRSLAGVTPLMQGDSPGERAGEGIRMQLNRAPVNMSMALKTFHFTKQLLAERKLNLFQAFYTETRILHMATGPYATPEMLGINIPIGERILNDFTQGNYVANILPTGSRLQSDEYAFDELLQLKEIGIKVPNSLFIDASAINAKADAAQQLRLANNGELSPEEEEAARIQMETSRAELQKLYAEVEKTQAAAVLDQARAQKNQADAQFNPHQARAQTENRRLDMEYTLRDRQLDFQERAKASDTAVNLVKIEEDSKNNKAKEVQASKTAAKKPAAKKSPKKAATRKPRK